MTDEAGVLGNYGLGKNVGNFWESLGPLHV